MLKKISILLLILVTVGVLFVLLETYLPNTGLLPASWTEEEIARWGNICLIIIIIVGIMIIVGLSLLEFWKKDEADMEHIKQKLVTITRYLHLIDAQAAQMKLESEGVKVYLTDEHMVLMNPLYSPLLGGVKLNVKGSDVERALKILKTAPPEEKSVEKDVPAIDPPNAITCPKCKSNDTYHEKSLTSLGAKIAFFFFRHSFFFPAKRMHCFSCGHKWKQSRKKKSPNNP